MQAPVVPKKKSLCSSMRDASPSTSRSGVPNFSKCYKTNKPLEPNTNDYISRHPAKMNTTEQIHEWPCCYSSSSNFCFWFILMTYIIAIWIFTLGVCIT